MKIAVVKFIMWWQTFPFTFNFFLNDIFWSLEKFQSENVKYSDQWKHLFHEWIDLILPKLSHISINAACKFSLSSFSDVEQFKDFITVPMMIYIGFSLLYCLIASAMVAFTVSWSVFSLNDQFSCPWVTRYFCL